MIATYLALLLSACNPPACYPIAPSSCEGDVCDITAPLKEAIGLCNQSPPIADTTPVIGARTGCRYELPAGRLRLTETIRICRSSEIVGQGGRSWGPRTVVYTDGGYTAFRLAYNAECLAAGEGAGAIGTVLRDFALISPIGTSSTSVSVGVEVEDADVLLSGLWIKGFVVGVTAICDHTNAHKANCNHFQLRDLRIEANEHTGVIVSGGDSNAGEIDHVNSSQNCWFGSRWTDQLGECACFIVRPFLDLTGLSLHASTCLDRDTDARYKGLIVRGDTQRVALVGVYSEGDNLDSELSQNSIVVGGLAAWQGKTPQSMGGWLRGRQRNALYVINDLDPANIVTFEIGNTTAPGVAFQVRSNAINQGWPLALKASTGLAGFWALTLANSEAFTVLRIAGKHITPSYSLGDFVLAPSLNRYWFGGGLITP